MIRDNSVDLICPADSENLYSGMTERRQHRRFKVKHMPVDCDMPSAS